MYNTDTTMKNIWLSLVRDFRTFRGLTYAQECETKLLCNMQDYRAHKWPERFQASVYIFKQDYQLENLFKRYRFDKDAFTDEQLQQITAEKFIATQQRIAEPAKEASLADFAVMQRARLIVKSILGPYDLQEHYESCQFGRRASVGTPLSQSYLDVKASPPFTGSCEQQSWFDKYLATDRVLSQHIYNVRKKEQTPLYTDCASLTLTNVPKSYKTYRSIMPNTDIGAFYTSGLNTMLEERLKSIKIDLSRQPVRHRIWAKKASEDKRYVTADLSAASDSFTFEMLNRLIPRTWLRALNLGRIRYAVIREQKYPLVSFMTMGIGFTFPLQTILFYALLKSMAELTNIGGRISVFGDDLIYPRKLHKYVVHFFPHFKLLLNSEKTFNHVNFRESCGGDYFHGVDVRPFQPEGSFQLLDGIHYAAFCHKVINGLLLRWDETEIPSTLHFLYRECIRSLGCLLQVPPSFPDHSGIKVQTPQKTWFMNWAPVKWHKDKQQLCFGYLQEEGPDRIVIHQLPYYWEALQPPKKEPTVWSVPRETLRWRRMKPFPKNYRSSITGRRLRKLQAVVTKKGIVYINRKVGSVNSWI